MGTCFNCETNNDVGGQTNLEAHIDCNNSTTNGGKHEVGIIIMETKQPKDMIDTNNNTITELNVPPSTTNNIQQSDDVKESETISYGNDKMPKPEQPVIAIQTNLQTDNNTTNRKVKQQNDIAIDTHNSCIELNVSPSNIHLQQTCDIKEPETIPNDNHQSLPHDLQAHIECNSTTPNSVNHGHTIETKQQKDTDINNIDTNDHKVTSCYHFAVVQDKDNYDKQEISPITKEDKYKTFVDYSKLYNNTKTSTTKKVKKVERINRIEIERRETGIVLDKESVAYNGWCTVKPSQTFIDNSKPKRIITNKARVVSRAVTTLPAVLSHSGDNEQMVLLMGYIREMIIQFDFAWILPKDVIVLCFRYMPIQNSNIFVLAGNNENYMEYHLFTSQQRDDTRKETQDDNDNYNYQRLKFQINDDNGKKIKILDEDFDCSHCGVCYAKNINIPLSMRKNHTFNDLICYSAIIKCGGEIIEDDMNFCTNYCNAIVFDTNQLLLSQKQAQNPQIKEEKNANAKGNEPQNEDPDGDGDVFINAVFGVDDKHDPKMDDLMEISCIELKLPRLKTKCQYKSVYSEYHGLIAMMMNKKNNNIYQLSFDNNCNWNKLKTSQYNHSYGNICMVNNDENLVVLGGGNNKMEIYDFQGGAWSNLQNIHYDIKYPGICYNFLYSNVIIAGGYDVNNSSNLSSCYDIVKNKWFKLPDLVNKHRCYPSVWHNINNPSIIYCFGDNSQNLSFIEYIDLRNNNTNYWTNLNDNDMYNLHRMSPSQIRNIVI